MRASALLAAAALAVALVAAPAAADLGGILHGFPAGLPQQENPMQQVPWIIPNLTSTQYRGTYRWTTCNNDEIIRPRSTQELAAAIKDVAARAAAAGRPLKMRTAHSGFGTIQSFPCAVQPHTPEAKSAFDPANPTRPLVVGILMDHMTRVLSVDKAATVMRVQAQIPLRDFYTNATAVGMSPPRSSLPWWQGLTLAGIFASSSHGSGLNTTSMICDWVKDVTWVDAAGTIHVTKHGTPEAKALCGGIGLLGSVTEFTLQMVPYSITRLSTWYVKDDDHIADDIDKMLKITPHLVVMWRPDIGKYTGHMQRPGEPGEPVVEDAVGNVIPQFAPTTARMLGPGLRTWQADYANRGSTYYTSFDAVTCTAALTSAVGAAWATKPGPLTQSLGMSTPVLEGNAPTNQIMSTECGDRCAWLQKDFQGTALDVEFAFEKSHLRNIIADIKTLIAKDLRGIPGWGAGMRCLLPGYYVFRFGKRADDASYTAMAANLKQPVYVQQQMLASGNTPGVPSRYEWVQEAYEQLLLCKYDAHPHWAKNWDRTFTNPKCPVPPKYGAGFAKMAEMQAKHDPKKVFEPELWSRMVAGKKYELYPKCTLDHACYCEADEHCADGFGCFDSLAFPQYKQCRPIKMN